MAVKTRSWDEAMATLAHYLAEATVPQRIVAWNLLQRRASDHVGIAAPGRLQWPEAWMHLRPEDLLEVSQADAA